MSRHRLFVCAFAVVAGCAAPKFAVIDTQEWAAVQPLPSPNDVDRLAARFARQHGLDLIFDSDQLFYEAPELDVTMLLLGKEARPVRGGERLGRVDFQAVLDRSRRGHAAHARLQQEFNVKQAELDRLQLSIKAQMGVTGTLTAEQQQRARQDETLRRRFHELQDEMARHEHEAVLAIFAQLKPEVEQLAKQHGLEAVFSANDNGHHLHYRRPLSAMPVGNDLTQELIRVDDQQVP